MTDEEFFAASLRRDVDGAPDADYLRELEIRRVREGAQRDAWGYGRTSKRRPPRVRRNIVTPVVH